MSSGRAIDVFVICDVAYKAGLAIMEVYESEEFEVKKKADNSPLTKADKISHKIIKKGLEELYPDIPVLSEEGAAIDFKKRKEWKKFWLVDPLDGTKEFINRNGEFTVNIALIENNKPAAGVIYVPVQKILYYTHNGFSFRQDKDGTRIKLQVDKDKSKGLTAVKSRSHASEAEEKFFSENEITAAIMKGSSLKFCMVAEGRAHVYYRHGPTMEWDTGAGHAIAEGAGARVTGLEYNKKVLKNGSFCVASVDLNMDN